MTSFVLSVILALSAAALTGCGSDDTASSNNNTAQNADGSGDQNSAPSAEDAAKGEAADGLEVVAETYHASEYYGKVLLIVTNKTGKVIRLKANADFYDENGALLNSDDDSEGDIAPDSTVCLGGLISDGDFADYSYKVTYTVDEWSTHSVDQDLTMEYEHDNEKVTVSITNHGELPASYVGYRAIFYKNGEITYEDSGACDDDDNEIKPGAACTGETKYNGDYDKGFDDVKVYFHGSCCRTLRITLNKHLRRALHGARLFIWKSLSDKYNYSCGASDSGTSASRVLPLSLSHLSQR